MKTIIEITNKQKSESNIELEVGQWWIDKSDYGHDTIYILSQINLSKNPKFVLISLDGKIYTEPKTKIHEAFEGDIGEFKLIQKIDILIQ